MNRSIVRWALLSILVMTFSAASFGQVSVGVSVRIGPPPLPVYAQPICPGPGYLWTPGYWAWSDRSGYYWVPGTWVLAPVGMFWTPGYWGWGGGVYMWHGGYWGPHVGFYGGINYGHGYTGVGFYGGEWRGERFYYNRSVTNVSVTNVTNVYNRTVIVHNREPCVLNGENGVGIDSTRQQEAWSRESHRPELGVQESTSAQPCRTGRTLLVRTMAARPSRPQLGLLISAERGGSRPEPPAANGVHPRCHPVKRGEPELCKSCERQRCRESWEAENRPFTPASRGGAAVNDRGGNNNGHFNDRPAQNRMNDRPAQNRGMKIGITSTGQTTTARRRTE